MPPLLDAYPVIGPAVIVTPATSPERFPASFYDLAKPVGNTGREPWPISGARGRSIRVLIRTATLAARLVRSASKA